MTKKEVRRIRQEAAARDVRSTSGAVDHHSTLTRRQAIALYAGLFGFVLACFALEGWWRTCA